MKKKLLTFLLVLFSSILMGQHSKEFLEFANGLQPIDTIDIAKKYKFEGQKEIGSYLQYHYSDYLYQFSYGNWKYYYGENVIMYNDIYDDFGHLIISKLYHQDGYILREVTTINLGTTARNLKEFLNTKHKYSQHLTLEKKYKYSKEMGKSYLFSEGQKLNNKRTGHWKKYNEDGTIKSEKKY